MNIVLLVERNKQIFNLKVMFWWDEKKELMMTVKGDMIAFISLAQ